MLSLNALYSAHLLPSVACIDFVKTINFFSIYSRKGMPIVAASLGFAITPSSTVAMRIAGAAAGGLVGFIAKNMIMERFKQQEDGGDDNNNNNGGSSSVKISPQVLLALETIKMSPSIASLGLKKLEQIARKCKVANDDLGEFFAQVFSEVVIDAITEDGSDLTELSDIIEFAETVGLSPAEVGDGFSIAAARLGNQLDKDERGFFTSSRPRGMLLQASKMFFLADKMLGASQGFYGKRLSVSLSFFTNEEFKNVITDACTDLFKRCIEGKTNALHVSNIFSLINAFYNQYVEYQYFFCSWD